MAEDLSRWIGKKETRYDTVALSPAQRMLATLDDVTTELSEGSPLPPLWHWLYFLSDAPMSTIGPDGHPKRCLLYTSDAAADLLCVCLGGRRIIKK